MIEVITCAFNNYKHFSGRQEVYLQHRFGGNIKYRKFDKIDVLNFCSTYEEEQIITKSFQANSFVWKPFLLSRLIAKSSKNDSCYLYLDSTDLITGLPKLGKILRKKSIALYLPKGANNLFDYTKECDLEQFTFKSSRMKRRVKQLEAGMIAFRVDPLSNEFFLKWADYMMYQFHVQCSETCETSSIVADRCDQSILTLLAYSKPYKAKIVISRFSNVHAGNYLESGYGRP
jgi:hypothetical protein